VHEREWVEPHGREEALLTPLERWEGDKADARRGFTKKKRTGEIFLSAGVSHRLRREIKRTKSVWM